MDYKVYVSKENYTGRPITAYWAPANAGSNYRELAEASLDANGVAKVYDFEEDVWYDPKLRRKVVVAKKHTGSESAAIERGKNMPLELRQKLEEALAKAIADNEKEMAEVEVLQR